jgi:hypothetical protein
VKSTLWLFKDEELVSSYELLGNGIDQFFNSNDKP